MLVRFICAALESDKSMTEFLFGKGISVNLIDNKKHRSCGRVKKPKMLTM